MINAAAATSAYSALVLNHGAANIGCRIWMIYGNAEVGHA